MNVKSYPFLLRAYLEAQYLEDEKDKKPLKINFVDFYPDFNTRDNFFTRILSKKYILEFSENPDILICSCFGSSFKKYRCKRIVFLGENISPNFNGYDYAFAFDFMNFSDRYMRLPLYYYYLDRYFQRLNEFIDDRGDDELINRNFCSIVVSNNIYTCDDRFNFFKALSLYKRVDSGGRAFNNIGKKIGSKHNFIKQYKFNICFENSVYPGYVTEKILEAFLANTIPIYFGSPSVEVDFNPSSFIDIAKFASFKEAIDYIRFLDSNDKAYLSMLKQNPLNNRFYNNLNHKLILDFLTNVIENGVIYHKDSMPLRDEHGLTKRLPLCIRLASFFIPIKSKRQKFREYLLKKYIKRLNK